MTNTSSLGAVSCVTRPWHSGFSAHTVTMSPMSRLIVSKRCPHGGVMITKTTCAVGDRFNRCEIFLYFTYLQIFSDNQLRFVLTAFRFVISNLSAHFYSSFISKSVSFM